MVTIYLDCDDTILNSSEVIIEILNERYGVNKTIKDLRDYRYRSIVGTATQEEILEIFQSEEFWKRIQFNPQFIDTVKKLKNFFKFVVISKGTKENLEAKEIHIREGFKKLGVDIEFIGIPLLLGSEDKFRKATVDMSGAIQIDDCASELVDTNAAVRILIQNNRRVLWNIVPKHQENLYAVDTWEEIEKILEFAKNNDVFMANPFVRG